MKRQAKVLVMTGSKLRHLFFAAEMAKTFAHLSVLVERFHVNTGSNYTNADVTPAMRDHFQRFDQTEKEAFEASVDSDQEILERVIRRTIEPGEINSDEVVDWIKLEQPDVIVVYSTSIIKEPLISTFPGRIFNLHAGLSPYYRGSGTNLFPFHNGELEYVGMTVHHLDAGIDSGDIILQGRPSFDLDDDPHSISCKNVVLGVELMTRVVERHLTDGLPESHSQNLEEGRLYLKKDFTDGVLEGIRQRLESGLIERYIEATRSVEIVSW
jgi:methionyl-tRNA formyltransferase